MGVLHVSEDLSKFLELWPQPATRILAGTQIFASRRVFISDPLDMAKTALTVDTPVGGFPVFVIQKTYKYHAMQPGYLANAFLSVEYSSNATVSWEPVASEKPASVFATEFSAEHGWMSIMDADTRRKVTAIEATVDNLWDDWLAKHFPEDIRGHHFAYVPFNDGGGVVVCGPGKGNGTYPAFLGRDEHGQPTQLVIDFCVRSIPE